MIPVLFEQVCYPHSFEGISSSSEVWLMQQYLVDLWIYVCGLRERLVKWKQDSVAV